MTHTHCDICRTGPIAGLPGEPCRYPDCALGQAGDPPVAGGPATVQTPVLAHDADEPNLTDVDLTPRTGVGFEIALVLSVFALAFAAAVWLRETWPAPSTPITRCPTPITGEVLVVTIQRGDAGEITASCTTARGRTPGKA
jgi:hypothetical protein